jgi:hypothetical protein
MLGLKFADATNGAEIIKDFQFIGSRSFGWAPKSILGFRNSGGP